ncbi:hypothetical protein [Ruminococcus sp.]|uniref:hypothetical protein n=1 Tax=Ruminococcus sp. TaxID=41978 RepID=UPI00300EB257
MVYRISRTPQLAVDCQISEHCGELEVRWDYLTGVLPESFVQNMFLYFLDTIEGAWENRPASAGIPVQEVEAYNATETEIPVTTLQNLIAAQVERTPNRIALTAGESVTHIGNCGTQPAPLPERSAGSTGAADALWWTESAAEKPFSSC